VSDIEVIEFTDPGCSWAWGTEPKLRLLQWRYGDRLKWRRVLGGLVGDQNNYVENFDPVRAAKRYIPYWRGAYQHTKMSYPTQLEWMYVSTEPAGRAVKAAELQSEEIGARVLRRLREQTFVFGKPPDTAERILDAVTGVPGLDVDLLAEEIDADAVEKIFHEDWEETRRPNQYVLTLQGDRPGIGKAKNTEGHWRYVFPTVLFRSADREETVPGWCDYEEYELAMEDVMPGSTDERRVDPTPSEYFVTWPTATEHELEVVCGAGATVPDEIVGYDWGEGLFFLTPQEAEARGVA
jgi:protein-disulfide isomerase-like protein with CxxC motif